MATHLVDAKTLHAHLGQWVVFDCRHDLTDPQAGPRDYAKGHIPGAFHAHLDRDLAGPVGNGSKGRHPLPIPGAFVRFLRTHGVHPDTQVVAYDDMGGAWAGRIWWLLRHYGHKDVALLDGGLQAWKAAGYPLAAEHHKARDGTFDGKPGHMPVRQADQVPEAAHIVDARAAERFRGDVEPLDPVAGHIPGATSLPYAGNLGPDGKFLLPDALAERFAALDPAGTVMYCGSGVTSAHNVLAMELAGLGTPALYPGSWSEWCQPAAGRPVEKGP